MNAEGRIRTTREQGLHLAGAAFVALFLVTFDNRPLVELLRTGSYYRDVLITFGAAWGLLEYIGRITRWLDGRYDWQTARPQRVAGQLLAGVLGASGLAYAIAYGQYRWIDPDHVFGTESFGQTEFPVIVLFVSFVNGLYGGISYYQWQVGRRREVPVEPAPAYATGLLVSSGHRRIQVPADQIALICLEHGLTWVITFENTRYHLDEPLQDLMQRLDPTVFFRVNRQAIVQLSACYAYESAEYGKIRLRLVPPLSSELLISQKTAPAFRKWMQR